MVYSQTNRIFIKAVHMVKEKMKLERKSKKKGSKKGKATNKAEKYEYEMPMRGKKKKGCK